MNKSNSDHSGFFVPGMVLSMFCWGLSWTSGKILSFYGDALTISFYRFSLTFISLFIILLVIRERLTIHRKGVWDLFCASALIALYTYFFFKGLSLGKAGAGGVLVTILNPIISYLIMLMLQRRFPVKNETIGLVIGILAGIILLRIWDHWDQIFEAGNTYFLLASLTWAILSLFTAKASRYGSPMSFSLWMYTIATVMVFLLSDQQENMAILKKADLIFWGNLFFSATITTSLATTFYFIATSKIGASKASSFVFLVPFSAAIGSWIFLREIPQLHTIIGGLTGIIAVYILNKKIKSRSTSDQ